MSMKSSAIPIAALLAAVPIWAQQQGGGGRGGAGGGTTTRPTTPTSPGGQPGGRPGGQPGQPGQSSDPFGQQQQMPQVDRPIMLSGEVRLQDGSPPPEPVTIYLDCDGQRVPKGYSNQKGHFNVDLSDRNQMAFADASYSGIPSGSGRGGATSFGATSLSGRSSGMGRYNLFGCALKAELAGFLSDPIELGTRSVFDNPDVGILILRRLEGVEGSAISFTSLNAPKKAKKSYEKAFKEVRKKKPNLGKADKELQKAVAEHPAFAAAWNLMGQIRLRQKDENGAREAFEKAAEADPKYLEPYAPLVRMALQGSRWDDAVQLSNHLLRLNPYMTEAHYFQAVAEYNLGRMDAAEKSVTEFHASDKAAMFPRSNHLLGMIHVKRGQYEPAAGAYRAYVSAQPDSSLAVNIEKQLKEWEALGVIEAQAAAQN